MARRADEQQPQGKKTVIPKKKTTRTPKPTAPAVPSAEPKENDRPVAARRRPAPTKAAAAAPKAVAAPKPAAPKGTPGRKPVVPEAVAANQPTVTVSDEDIRIRAYFLSIEYRGSGRDDVDFWLLAERELRGK